MESANKPFSEKIKERTPLPNKFWKIALVALPVVLYLVIALVVPVAMDGPYCFSTASDAGANGRCERGTGLAHAINKGGRDGNGRGNATEEGELQPGIDWDTVMKEDAARGGMDNGGASLAAQEAFEEELRRQGLDKDGNPIPGATRTDNTDDGTAQDGTAQDGSAKDKDSQTAPGGELEIINPDNNLNQGAGSGADATQPTDPANAANAINLSFALREALMMATEPGPDATQAEKDEWKKRQQHRAKDVAADKADGTTDGVAEGEAGITPFTADFLQALLALVANNLVSVEAIQPIHQNGGTATANLGLIFFGDVPVETDLQLTLVWSNGRWQLAQSMSCSIVESMGITCPDWLRELNKRTAAGQMANDATGQDTATNDCGCLGKKLADAIKPKTVTEYVTTKSNVRPNTLLDAVEIAKKLRANGLQKLQKSARAGVVTLRVATIQDALRLFLPQEYPL